MTPSICVGTGLRRRIAGHLRRAGGREVGGILLGEQLVPGSFRLVDFSIDEVSGSAAHFCRSTEFHGEVLTRFFERTGSDFRRYNYLGEWHSHPRYPVQPSVQDCKTMLDLVGGERDIPFAVLLVVRLDFLWFLKASATIFSRHRSPENMVISWHEGCE